MSTTLRLRLAVALLLGGSALPTLVTGQPGIPVRPGGAMLFQLDLSGTPAGELPASLELLKGTLEVALRNGVPMLKASSASEFLITLAQPLPADFTLEFDLVPKLGSNPQDLSFEGTPTINQGDASAHVLWHATGYLSVIGGGGDTYETPMPEDLRATLPGLLTHVALEVQGSTLRLYTNGRRLYTLQKQFARGAVLRVFLGAQNGGTEAVYLAGLRITAGVGLGIVAQGGGVPSLPSGSTNYVPPGPGNQPAAQPPQINNPLPVVPNTATPPNSSNTQAQQQTASQAQASTGILSSAATPVVTVQPSANGLLVDWTPVISPGVYTVQRWKLDDPLCCNNTSPASPPLTIPPWQDSRLSLNGTYVYQVTLTTSAGMFTGQTQFVVQSSPGITAGSPPPPPPPPPTSVLLATGATGTITPLPAPPPAPPAPIAAQAGLPTASSTGGNNTRLAPQNPTFTGTPAWVRVNWAAPANAIRGIVYTVDRYLESNPSCCPVRATGLGTFWWTDEGTQWAGTYVYRITAVYPDGSVGWVDARWARPDPVNPANFRASPGVNASVILQWDPVPNVDWYYLFGPGVPYGSFQIAPTVTHFTVTGLPSGTYTWQVASYYSSPNAPAPVSTAAAAFPQVTFTLP